MSVEAVSPADVYPVYLRLPDAEINRARGLGINQDDLDDSQDR